MKTSNRITKTVLIGAATLAAVALTPPAEGAFPMNIETVLIEAPGGITNGDDTVASPQGTYHGCVSYNYHIGKYEIAQGQWKDFLNEVAKNDPYGLWTSNMGTQTAYSGITRAQDAIDPNKWTYSVSDDYKDLPVVYVTLLDAKRFCNWLTNQKLYGTSGTENGIYTISAGDNAVRDDAVWQAGGIALPDEDEWYKAAFYDPNKTGYNMYSTTGINPSSGDTMDPSKANYNNSYYNNGGSPYRLNPVGFYKDYASAYGAVDMTGNVWEWTDSKYSSSNRAVRGAAHNSNAADLAAGSSRNGLAPTAEGFCLGFRVASLEPIPEPSTYGVIGGALVGLLCLIRRRRKKA
ncbi:MAG: SUMF1/EgtB/PvdO family nonheme iron enzyme [Puniceicoccales bacterium]|jgi:formylglycine-generating enzyme required for sulfatase activity|nr:SUMF1/EgtB/PvdO family nonheme iron enzyme [Puniceicoccales bacterium]